LKNITLLWAEVKIIDNKEKSKNSLQTKHEREGRKGERVSNK
jgi:hypothetical protein